MPDINECDLCLEVSIFETLVKWGLHDICAECAEKIQEEDQAVNRKLDQQ